MKKLIFALALLTSTSAFAQRYYTTELTCAEAKGLVDTYGAVTLYYGDGLYDRYVAHQGYCVLGEVAQPGWVPTLDSESCFVGYTCKSRDDHP